MNISQYTDEKKHIEQVLNFTDNRVLGVLFYLAQIGFVMLRRNFGARILKPDLILMSWSGLLFIAALADWITDIPFLGAKLDFATFKLFAHIYLVRAIYHAVKAYLNSRKIPFLYSRHLGDGYVADILMKHNLPFFKRSVLRINAFGEPVVMCVIGLIVHKTLSPNLGTLLVIISIAMLVVGVYIIHNHDEHRYDLNDSMVLGNMTQKNMEGAKPSMKKGSATRATSVASPSPQRPNKKP